MSFIYFIPESHAVAVERFGKFSRIQKQGLRFKIPFIESVKHPVSWRGVATKRKFLIELAEQQSDTLPRQCQTRDNVTIDADAVIYWKIMNPRKALYEIDILPKSITDSALNALRSCIGELTLDQLLSGREQLNKRISAQMAEVTQPWGVETKRVEIQEIKYSKEIADAMMQEMASERKRRAQLAESEGAAQAELNIAKSKAESILLIAKAESGALTLRASAEREYLHQLSQSGSPTIGGQALLAQKFIEGLEKMSMHPANKIFLPNSFRGLHDILLSEEVIHQTIKQNGKDTY